MVRILEFRLPESSETSVAVKKGSGDRPEEETAEIIIFPGVRIERHVDDGPEEEPKRRAKRARAPSGRNR